MIIKGKSRAGPQQLATHLGNVEKNERVSLIETRGTIAQDLRGALVEMDAYAVGTRCEKSLYHAAISPEPPHRLTDEQRREAIEALEARLGLDGHARIVVMHEKLGRQHIHVVWSRIDLEKMRSVSDSHNYRKHEEVARDLERRFGHDRVQGPHHERDGVERPDRTPSRAELQQQERTGITGKMVKTEVTAAFRASDGPEAFRAALEERGYLLARGDQRDYVIIDRKGGTHSLARRIDGMKGFGVRVTPGSKSYVLTYGPDRRRVTLGDVSAMSLKHAWQKGHDILKAPKEEEPDKPTLTFKAARDTFLAIHVKPNNKASTAAETERLLTRHFAALDKKPIATLKTGDFVAITDQLLTDGKPSEANHAFTAVKTMLRFCLGRSYIDRHPLEALKRPVEARNRDRWLTDEELAKVLAIAPNFGLYGLLIRVLILTGQRLAQIANLRRGWIEGDTIRFPAPVTKSGHDHLIPIGETTNALLATRNTDLLFENEDGKPFNNYGNGHLKFLKACGIPHFTRHDLRRSYSTGLARIGIAPHIIERLLDHSTGTISGVAAIYNRHHFLPEMRTAVEKWEAHLSKLASAA